MPLLATRSLTKHFGGLAAVSQLDLTVDEGEIVGLIGPNGAGKTTCFNLLSGFLRPTSGTIAFAGGEITGLKPHQIVAGGLVRTFQLTTLFQDMTALENVLIGLHLHSSLSPRQVLFGRRVFPADEIARSREALAFTGLAGHADQLARNLPHGHQRVLGIAMALAARPRLLLLDEPVTGMNLEESERVMTLVKTIRDGGTTILLVENSLKAVMVMLYRIGLLYLV
jgi:branched-chain amino acid transport system ATP-binding protein